MVKFSKHTDLLPWFERWPREWSAVIAMRISLRVVPMLTTARDQRGDRDRGIILPAFRCAATSWFAGAWSNHDGRIRTAAADAADAARAAISDVDDVAADAVRAIAAAADVADVISLSVAAYAAARASRAAAYFHAATDVGASADILAAASVDATALGAVQSGGVRATELAIQPLWPSGPPKWAYDNWTNLRRSLLDANEDWDVWTEWYESRLADAEHIGLPNRALEFARIMIAEGTWRQGPKIANAQIGKIIKKYKSQPADTSESKTQASWDFFLSYSKLEESYARWVQRLLDSAGYRVFAQFNDMPPGSNFVREMQRGLANSSRFIALLSSNYEKSNHCQAEWSAAYNADPAGSQRKLIQFLTQACDVNPLAKQIVYQQLIGLSAADAADAILKAVGYSGLTILPPPDWPGIVAIDKMQAAAGGVYDVLPGERYLLERSPAIKATQNDDSFTPEELYKDFFREISGFLNYTQKSKGNSACSSRLKERVAILHQAVAVEFSDGDPLAINRNIVWVLRVLAHDKADGVIPQNDELEYYAGDLYGYYNWLEHIFPKLKAYRKMDARNRFEPPTVQVERDIAIVYESFGNPVISQKALSSELSAELKQAGEGIEEAKVFADNNSVVDKAMDVTVESHTDAATRSLAVWSWLANSREKFAKSGKKAEEVEIAIENYEKLYKRVSPHMTEYIAYLLKWFF